VQSRNYDNLCIWQSVGADVENGDWAIFGARHGTYKTMFTDWDFTEVQWFDNLKRIWEEECAALKTPNGEIMLYGRELKQRLSLPIVYFEAENSKFFKHHYATSHKNLALMSTEMSVIRKLEGW
jgi:hypothetical protein